MKTYRVMVHPEKAVPIVVKDGFCWPAFLLGPLWFLANGMWLNFILVFAFVVASNLFFAGRMAGGFLYSLLGAANIVVWILIGALANWLLTAELQEQGYVQRGTVRATSLLKAGKLAQQEPDGA
jgi:hypothetical protein